ncbi:MAG: insulinase family protein [Bacteroidia bacterium]|nr:insulinase family protein [Bacteroidia bacterium]
MKTLVELWAIVALLFLWSCKQEVKFETKTATDKNGYIYEYVTDDPFQARIYTLKNGLKVYLTDNKNEPRIQGLIAVRAGSKNDPPETTGLAHYFEHMMFKGTDKIGTIDWPKEKVMIEQISGLFEEHRTTTDTLVKKKIYAKIDSISNIAALYAVANEYDKMSSSIGANGTNAWTSDEETVYMNNIPSNELGKWLMLERERFNNPILRIFHTELETVYEEFNRAQDSDYRKADEALMKELFKKHPYGTQTTIGKAEHLKNPSMVNILNFFKTYYVPNNMAICMSGDLDYDNTICLIDKYWGDMKPAETFPPFTFEKEDPIAKPVIREVLGPDAEFVNIGYRLNGVDSLIDIDLVQKQKVLDAYAYSNIEKDYGYFVMSGNPREGQSLDEVRDLLLAELDKIKKGEFDDWLPQAIINQMQLERIEQLESNWKVFSFVNTFINEQPWADYVSFIDDIEKITKEQIVKFANDHFADNYITVLKRTGKDENVVHVSKPPITKVTLNRDSESEFLKQFTSIESERIKPVFLDFEKEIGKTTLNSSIELNYIKNITNELFSLNYIVDMGSDHDKKLALAVKYLPYIGTSKYSPADFRKELFKYGLRLNVYTDDDRSYIFVSGLNKSFEKGMELLEHILAEAKSDQKAYDDLVEGIIKERADNKLNKYYILWQAMYNYGIYGTKSPFTNILTTEELKKINPAELTGILKKFLSYKHKIFYYGPMEIAEAKNLIDKYHTVTGSLADYPQALKFTEQAISQNKVYLVNYDMVQTNIVLLAKDVLFNKDIIPDARLYGDYFGSGLSSIFFQEIREAKGLAYSASSSFSIPQKPDKSHYLSAFIGTQPDKFTDATDAMLNILNNMPKTKKQFDFAREAIMKNIESQRIIKENKFWTYLSNLDRGITYDIRKDVYEKAANTNIDKFGKFFDEHVKGKNYIILVMGDKKKLDKKILARYGEVKELSLEEIFNY